MKTNYEERLQLPLEGKQVLIFDKDGTLLADRYSRIVIGKRGPYVEFENNTYTLNIGELAVPAFYAWKINSTGVYYHEYRTWKARTKFYYQVKEVDYADYKPGYWYASPFDLLVEIKGKRVPIITKLKDEEID